MIVRHLAATNLNINCRLSIIQTRS
jgi:hypothetical protein